MALLRPQGTPVGATPKSKADIRERWAGKGDGLNEPSKTDKVCFHL